MPQLMVSKQHPAWQAKSLGQLNKGQKDTRRHNISHRFNPKTCPYQRGRGQYGSGADMGYPTKTEPVTVGPTGRKHLVAAFHTFHVARVGPDRKRYARGPLKIRLRRSIKERKNFASKHVGPRALKPPICRDQDRRPEIYTELRECQAPQHLR